VDGSGSVLGIDPTTMYVVDTIEGTGAIGQASVTNIGEGDLWFVSPRGVQSLGRVVQEKVNPLTGITDEVRSLAVRLIQEQSYGTGDVQALYSQEEQFVLYLFPDEEKVLLIDTKLVAQGAYRVSLWPDIYWKSLARRLDGRIFAGLEDGEVAEYTGYTDDGVSYPLVYASPWLVGDPQLANRIKIPKQLYAVIYGREDLSVTTRLAFNYLPAAYEEVMTSSIETVGGEYGIGEYGEDEYGTGHRMRRQYAAGMGEGIVMQVWVVLENDDVDARIALQELGAHVKIGRVA